MAKVSLRAYNREIETMIDRGQLDEAIAHCRHILKTFPKHLETYRLLGKAYLEGKRYGDAADIFLRILASVPDDFVAQVGMSIIRDEENKLDDAIWHMERAFETQPSNPAIQSELQRLYGRRDGVQPPRIRMTRGALAHMYVQGELYPQAISEIKSVLKDDAGRADMQALLARACYRTGLKNEAADVSSTLLKRYPYSLDANRVLTEILGMEKPENAQTYRQRVNELDPYAAQTMGTVFQSNEVPEAAVSIERLDWNGQPVSMQSDWGEAKAISLESGTQQEEEPDWYKTSQSAPPPQPTPASIFESSAPSQPAPAQPAEDIPDFLRAAGWGESTGAFDESKSAFAEEESTGGAEHIAQGDLPDWVKAMKPADVEPEPAASQQEEELPDWISNIGTGALSSQPSDLPDWLNQSEESSTTLQANESQDWMNQVEQTPTAAMPGADDEPDWLKNLGQQAEATPQPEGLDWVKDLGSESDFTPQSAETETPDWLKSLGSEPEAASTEEDKLDWLKQFNTETEAPVSEPTSNDFDFLNQLTEEPVLQTPESTAGSSATDNLGMSEQEQDDSFAWLESLAAKQGASEGLLTKPEDRLEEEPEWVKQAKGLSSTPPPAESTVSEPSMSVEELGKTEQEQDDSFAWLESLAAKQGATEGLLTKPEDRLEDEPEWVKQAKDLGAQQPSVPASQQEQPAPADETLDWLRSLDEEKQPEPEPEQPAKVDEVEEWLQDLEGQKQSEPTPAMDETAMWLKNLDETTTPQTPSVPSVEELGKSEQEQDDSFAWLESLAAKHGATEGLLTKPEDRLDQEPEWVKQAKDLSAQQPPTSMTPEPEPEPEQPAAIDETAAWLRNLDEEETQPEPAADETSMWLNNLKETEPETMQPMESSEDALPAWMQNIEQEEASVAESNIPVSEPQGEEQAPAEGPLARIESKLEEESIPSWLAELDKEEEKTVSAADEDLPAWLRAEETAPAATERTHASDWKPAEEKRPGIVYSPPLEETKQPEIIYSPPLEEAPEPEPVAEKPQEQPVQIPEPLKVEPQPTPTSPPAERYKEPVTRRTPSIPTVDPVLSSARNELSRSNIPGALDSYTKLIKKGRFLDEVIYDLREALYRYPVEVNIWQSLGDAYMRANRLQDALDAYTKAEELLR